MSDPSDSYEEDEPIEKIREIRRRPPDFVTSLSTEHTDLTITIHRESGCWWAEIIDHGEYVAGDNTFDGLCERLAEGLHVLGLNRERGSVTITTEPQCGGVTASGSPRVFVFREQTS